MSVGPPIITDVPKESFPRPIANGRVTADVKQNENVVDVEVTRLCDVSRVDRIERTTTHEYKNDAPQNDVWAVVGGAALLGVGALSIANPRTLAGEEEKLSEKEARGFGYGLVGVGALLLTVPLIDYFRAHRVAEHRVEIVEQPGPSLGQNVACGSAWPSTLLSLRIGSRVVPLSTLDGHGRTRVDLDAALPGDLALRNDTIATLEAGPQEVGNVSLSSLYARREATAWQHATASGCATSIEETACAEHVAYFRAYPESEHAAEARSALDGARERREVALEQADFDQLDLGACKTLRTREAVRTSCAPLASFVVRHPAGAHGVVVREALRSGNEIATRLREAEERATRATVPSPGAFIPYKGNGGGPTLCRDGMWSHSSGRGTCSHHGGVAR